MAPENAAYVALRSSTLVRMQPRAKPAQRAICATGLKPPEMPGCSQIASDVNPREPNGFSMNRAAIDARRIRMRSKTRSYRAAWRFIRQCEPVHTSRPTGHIMLAKVGED